MKRSLVQGDESARHPFLKSLPRHVRHGGEAAAGRRGRLAARLAGLRFRLRSDAGAMQDARDFLLAYCACFVAVMAFIA